MTDRFVIWQFEDVPRAYVPDDLLNMARLRDLWMGASFADDMPEGLQFTASPDYPKGTVMLDSFGNTESVIPISPRLKRFLQDKGIAGLEFLPVDMLDHAGDPIERYFLLNAIDRIDAIDPTRTGELEIDDLNEAMYETVEDLVLRDDVIPADTQIFRVKGLYDVTCVRRELAEEIDDNGFTGIHWREVADYSR